MNIYAAVTDRILKQLEQGVVPWRKTWTNGLPRSLPTGRDYRGINILLLDMSAHHSRYWLTYREAQRLGGHVRRGEKATPVYYWHWRTEKELQKLRIKTPNPAPCSCFMSFVFNLDQVEGVAVPEDDFGGDTPQPLEVADRLVSVMPDKPEIVHQQIIGPRYNRHDDQIILPHLSQFENAAEYYVTLFHELVHATGHERRLNRFAEGEGDRRERYSFEELVAEFGASFLCAFTGIHNPSSEELTAAYISGWAEVFRKDKHILVRAASAAQRAVDYIRGKVITEVAQDERVQPGSVQLAAVGE